MFVDILEYEYEYIHDYSWICDYWVQPLFRCVVCAAVLCADGGLASAKTHNNTCTSGPHPTRNPWNCDKVPTTPKGPTPRSRNGEKGRDNTHNKSGEPIDGWWLNMHQTTNVVQGLKLVQLINKMVKCGQQYLKAHFVTAFSCGTRMFATVVRFSPYTFTCRLENAARYFELSQLVSTLRTQA